MYNAYNDVVQRNDVSRARATERENRAREHASVVVNPPFIIDTRQCWNIDDDDDVAKINNERDPRVRTHGRFEETEPNKNQTFTDADGTM